MPAATLYRAKPNAYGRGKHFPRNILTPDFVRSCIELVDGELVWRRRDDSFFLSPQGRRVWNAKIAGRAAALRTNTGGYKFVTLCGYNILVHRLIWLLEKGVWPAEIDHINGVRADNRIENLREATRSINSRNRALRSDNSSGYPGIYFRKTRWRAHITVEGKARFLGGFPTYEEALAARLNAEADQGFTERHGRAA